MIKTIFNIILAMGVAAAVALVATRGDLSKVGDAVGRAYAQVGGIKEERVARRDASQEEQEAARIAGLSELRLTAADQLAAAERLAAQYARLAEADTDEAEAAEAIAKAVETLRAVAAEQKPADDADPQEAQDVPFPVTVIIAEPRRIDGELRLSGRLAAARRVEVRAQTSGVVQTAPKSRGDRVRAGEILCRIEPGDRPLRRAEAEARLRQAQAEAQTQNALAQRGFTSRNAAVGAASNQDVIRAQIAQIDADIARLRITSPLNGVIEQGPAEPGALLQVGGLCATVATFDPITIRAYASEQEISRLTQGAVAQATLLDGRRISGRVTFIARAADAATRTFEIEAQFPNSDGALRDGMTAALSAALPAAQGSLIPRSAVTLDETGRLGVKLAAGGAARFQEVEILRDGVDGFWVRGLSAGSQVIVVGQEYVADGAAVAATAQTPQGSN